MFWEHKEGLLKIMMVRLMGVCGLYYRNKKQPMTLVNSSLLIITQSSFGCDVKLFLHLTTEDFVESWVNMEASRK